MAASSDPDSKPRKRGRQRATEEETPNSEREFIVVTYDEQGRPDAVALYRARPEDAFKSGRSRAVVAGSRDFQVYQIRPDGSGLKFERVLKA